MTTRVRHPWGRVYSANRQYQAELKRLDVAALRRIADAFKVAEDGVLAELGRLVSKIETARAAGEPIHPAWLFQADRLVAVESRAQHEYRNASRLLRMVLDGQRDAAVAMALRHARGYAETALGPHIAASWATLPAEQIRQAVGFAASGPLSDLLERFGPEAAAEVRRAIVQHIALGRNPRRLATAVRQATGASRTRALTIARTETLRAYREAQRQAFVANPRIVSGWVWTAALDRRTCVACWAMHGTLHAPDETLDGHPNCRCSMVPLTYSWESLLGGAGAGLPDTRVAIPTGEEVFANLSAADQRAIVGPTRYALLQSGQASFGDLVVQRRNRDWGTSRQPATIAEVKGARRKRKRRVRQRR